MEKKMTVKVLEVYRIAPPPDLPLPSSLTIPFTFFDLFFCNIPPVQRLFLYHIPGCNTSAFLSSHLPNLRRSLSLALHRFYPLAGNVVVPEDGSFPFLSYADGDTVSLRVAESEDNLDELVSNKPKRAERFHSLVPSLSLGENKQPVLSLQVTLFPDRGVGIGVCVHHGVVDGSASTHFVKTWASFCRPNHDAAIIARPIFDRDLIPDPAGLRELFWKQMKEFQMTLMRNTWYVEAQPDEVRATFVLTRAQIDDLRTRLMAKSSNRYSSFTLVSSVIWVCLTKARRAPDGSNDGDLAGYGFVPDCRARLNPPVPTEYFGNCTGACVIHATRGEMIQEDAVAEASARIREKIRELEGGGVLKGAQNWIQMIKPGSDANAGDMLSVAGSPNLRVYEVDFGWGRPRKVEVVSIGGTGAMSLAESGDGGEGGMEVGLVLPKDVMHKFDLEFQGLRTRCISN